MVDSKTLLQLKAVIPQGCLKIVLNYYICLKLPLNCPLNQLYLQITLFANNPKKIRPKKSCFWNFPPEFENFIFCRELSSIPWDPPTVSYCITYFCNESIINESVLCWQNLTGGVNGGVHVTDVTNASRTLLMNINTAKWDPLLCR